MAQTRTVTRDVPLLDVRATFDPKTVDVEKRTVELTWTTGAAVLRGGFWSDPYWEELSLDPKHVRMGRLQSGNSPMLNSHSSYEIRDILGVVVGAAIVEKKSGTATVRFDSGPEGEDAFRRVREGTLRNVSVGYRTYKMQKVEGGDATVPTYRAIDWEPYEISLVPIGADAGAVTRSGGGMLIPCEFIQEQRTMPDPVETPAPIPQNPAPAATSPAQAPVAPASAPTVDAATRAQIERAAIQRVVDIQRIGRALNRPQAEIDAAVANPALTTEAFRAAAVDALANAPAEQGGVIPVQGARSIGTIMAGEDSRDKFRTGAMAWLFTRAALGELMTDFGKASGQKVELDPGEFRGFSLLDLARESLERQGVKTRGMSKPDLVALAFTHRGAGGMATTSDFAILLENAQGKILLARYKTTPDTYSKACRIGSFSDFRPSPRYRTGAFSRLDKLLEGGEYVQKSISDAEKQSLTGDTFGNIVAISRKTIINDDMGAFVSVPSDLGRAAKLGIEMDFYALLALNAGLGPTMSDGLSLFHATHKNIGAGAALSAASLDLDSALMAAQTDVSGNEVLDLKPALMYLPRTLGGQAKVINDSAFDPDTLANKAQMKVNIAGKMFNEIVATARLTGTRRYEFADPGIAPCFEVAFLDGQQEPYLETHIPFDHDGVKWKVRLDVVVGAIDFRGAVTNAGA